MGFRPEGPSDVDVETRLWIWNSTMAVRRVFRDVFEFFRAEDVHHSLKDYNGRTRDLYHIRGKGMMGYFTLVQGIDLPDTKDEIWILPNEPELTTER